MNLTTKKVVVMLILLLVLAMDVRAFQDITSGIQANMNAAYWTIAFSVVILGGVLVWLKQPAETKKTAATSKKKAKK